MSSDHVPSANRMPVMFIGHGSPMNIVESNEYTAALRGLASTMPTPSAILVISAHWLTRDDTHVTCSRAPRQMHDFFGFPDEVYSVVYEAPGSPELATEIRRLAPNAVHCDPDRGIDHAAWAVLVHLHPQARIPVLELSLDIIADAADHVRIARALAPLRERGVLIIGSGNIVHNLHDLVWSDVNAPVFDWAGDFDARVRDALIADDIHALEQWATLGPWARRAVPTPDHFLPLLYTAALRTPDDTLTWIHEGFHHASISMRSLMFAPV